MKRLVTHWKGCSPSPSCSVHPSWLAPGGKNQYEDQHIHDDDRDSRDRPVVNRGVGSPRDEHRITSTSIPRRR